ncbi:MAG TPA: hypothetical protein VEB39_06045, partial [Sphingomicrobium sp.]|nr:hypothetical protein [Sphingomicrobium sp.]
MRQLLDQVRGHAESTNNALKTVIETAGQLSPDLTEARSSSGTSATTLISRLAAIIDGAISIAGSNERQLLLAPTSRLETLGGALSSIHDQLVSINSSFQSLGQVASFDPAADIIFGTNSNISIRPNLDSLQSTIDKALEAYLVVAAAVRPKGIGTYNAASEVLTQKAAEAGQLMEGLKKQVSAFSERAQALESQAASVSQTQGEAQRLAEEIEKARRTAEENEQKILASSVAADEARS